MTIRVKCKCGKQLAVKDEAAGRRVKCPQCQQPVLVPEPAEESDAADDEWDDAGEEEEAAPPRRSASAGRRGKPAARGRGKSGGKSGMKSADSGRGLIIGLSAGGGVLVVALLVWFLWPGADDENFAVNSAASDAVPQTAASNSSESVASVPGAVANNTPGDPDARYAFGRMADASPHATPAQMTDAANQTVFAGMVAESRAVPWTKPDDILVDDSFPSGANAFAEGEMMFADGSVRYIHIQDGLIRDKFRGLFTIAGGEPDPLLNLYPATHSLVQPTYPTPVEHARQAAARSERKNALRQVAVAFMNYQQTYRYWPPAAIYGPDGKPWHSWRVAILPYLGEGALYNKYDATVPWDHPRNAEVLNAMPAVFRDPLDDAASNRTRYLLITGKGTAFPTVTSGSAPQQTMPSGSNGAAATTLATGSPVSGAAIAQVGPVSTVAMPRALAKLPDEVVKDAPFDVNQFWVSVPADQNAAPFYLDALFEFHPSVGVCFPEAVRQQRMALVGARAKRSYNLQVEWYRDLSMRNIAERDAVLAEHEAGFQKLIAAQQRPRCVFETGWDIPALGPLVIAGREVAQLSRLKIERDIERGDFDAAIRTAGMLLRFSRDLRVRTPLGVQFLADSIDTVADSSLITPILKAPALTAAQTTELLRLLKQHDAELQTLNPALSRLRADYVLRRLLLHQVQNGTDEFSSTRLNSAFGSTSDSLGAAMLASLNADRSLADALMTELPRPEMGQMLDVVARSMKPADYEAGVRSLKEKYQVQANALGQSYASQSAASLEWMKQNQAAMASFMASVQSAVPAGTPPAQQAAAALPILEKSLADEKTPRGQLLLALWASKFENDMGDFPLCSVDLRGATRRSVMLTLAALRHWYATHREPPMDLASVCREAGLSDVPRDFYSDGPVRMLSFTMDSPPIQYPHGRPTDKPEKFLAGEWVIYSVGPDGIDDRVVSDWAYNPGAKGDWPFSLGRPQTRFPAAPGASGL